MRKTIHLTKEVLEAGIVIGPNGETRMCKSFRGVKKGELHLRCSFGGTRSNFKASDSIESHKKGVSVIKSRKQAAREALCVTLYYLSVSDC